MVIFMERPNPDEVLNALLEKNKKVVAGEGSLSFETFNKAREQTAKEGQKPNVVVIACSDSRVPIEEIFAAYPGEIFTIRTAGNVLDDIGKASLEYALDHLPTSLVVVLGHTHCGAVTATVNAYKEGENMEGSYLHSILEKIKPVVVELDKQNEPDLLNASIVKNAKRVVIDILSTLPLANQLTKEGKIKVVSMMYDLDTGEVKLVG